MPKERSINPAQAQRKAEKAKLIKKGKAEAAARRNEKLARRNPDRLQKQLDDLVALEYRGGRLTSHEQKVKEELERDLNAVRRARDLLGPQTPSFGSRSRSGRDRERIEDGSLGKRRRNWTFEDDGSDESDVPDEIKAIPLPRDTPPPIPKDVLAKWYQSRRSAGREHGHQGPRAGSKHGSGEDNGFASTPLQVESKTIYESAPVVRDLRKEAVNAFVPASVRLKIDKSKGLGGLVEPEEADALEKEGYMQTGVRSTSVERGIDLPHAVTMKEVNNDGD